MNNIMKATLVSYVIINMVAGSIITFIGITGITGLLIYALTTGLVLIIGITQFSDK